MDVYPQIRREGMIIRETTWTFDLHRDTVRKMLAYSVATVDYQITVAQLIMAW